MKNQIKFILGSILVIPILPLMYFQGKKLKKKFPTLPEASGNEGIENQPGQPFRLMTIGESTIAGVGVKKHTEGFTGSLANYLAKVSGRKIHWKVIAKSGYTAFKVAKDLIPKSDDFSPNLIAIGLGANDTFEFNSPQKWKRDINLLIIKLKALYPDTPIVFLNMPPVKTFPAFTKTMKLILGNLVELLGNELEKIIEDHDLVFYNKEKITLEKWSPLLGKTKSKKEFYSDGVHPSAITYQVWGKDFGQFLFEKKIIRLD